MSAVLRKDRQASTFTASVALEDIFLAHAEALAALGVHQIDYRLNDWREQPGEIVRGGFFFTDLDTKTKKAAREKIHEEFSQIANELSSHLNFSVMKIEIQECRKLPRRLGILGSFPLSQIAPQAA